ncbi:MAG: hypothetical protein KBS55_06105 [Bacteroidales bacterium]|nr:hypothetical protein [Candidatus Cryptobacteroides aphodequi]
MKKSAYILSILAISLSGCLTPKAEYTSAEIVTLEASRYSVKEDAGELKIPVTIFSDKHRSLAVTYKVTDSTAVAGKHYTHENKSGVINVTNDPKAKSDSITISLIDSTGIFTGNKILVVELVTSADENVHMGATTKCVVKIIDVDGGMSLIIGNWSGTGKSDDGKSVTADIILEEYTPEEDDIYPDANIMIAEGSKFKDPVGNSWESQGPIIGRFDEDTYEIEIYPGQPFDGGNFGEDIGVLYVALDNDADYKVSWFINVGEDVLSFKDKVFFSLYSESGDTYKFSGYSCGTIAELNLTKVD